MPRRESSKRRPTLTFLGEPAKCWDPKSGEEPWSERYLLFGDEVKRWMPDGKPWPNEKPNGRRAGEEA